MDYEKLYAEMLNYRNEEQAEKMSAYMLNKFKHIGIRTPERRKIFKDFFKEYKKEQEKSEKIDWDFINNCWKNEYRELQYSALDYLQAVKNILTDKDIPKLKTLALSKSWWDTIDYLDMIIGGIALKYPKVNDIILQWSTDENIWLRRIAIDYQLLRKEKTNTELLEKIIENNCLDLQIVKCKFYNYWEPNLLIIPLRNYLISKEKCDKIVECIRIIDRELRK